MRVRAALPGPERPYRGSLSVLANLVRRYPLAFRRRVSQPFFAAADRFSLLLPVPLLRPPFLEASWVSGWPRPEPDLLPPPHSLFIFSHARLSAAFLPTPPFSYLSSICSALRFCLSV